MSLVSESVVLGGKQTLILQMIISFEIRYYGLMVRFNNKLFCDDDVKTSRVINFSIVYLGIKNGLPIELLVENSYIYDNFRQYIMLFVG